MGNKSGGPFHGLKTHRKPGHFDGIHKHSQVTDQPPFPGTGPGDRESAHEDNAMPMGMSEAMNVNVADQGRQGKLGLLKPGRLEALKRRLANAQYDGGEGNLEGYYPGMDTEKGEARV